MNQLANPALEQRVVMLPLSRLSPETNGVRRTNGVDITELAASINAEGLLENLIVTPDASAPLAGAAEFEQYKVVGGQRRLRAMRHLIKEGARGWTEEREVPCLVVDASAALSASLAENTIRQPMHPADEFVAFRSLIDQGMPIENVAARFGVTPAVVQRRLKLANISPKLFELFRQDKLDLDQMMALAIEDDHEAQEHAWFKGRDRSAAGLRAALTKKEINAATDPIARFVGVSEYEAAGGSVRRDMFDDKLAYVGDRTLLQKLAAQKLEAAAEAVRKEGWSAVELRERRPDYAEQCEYTHMEPSSTKKPDDAEKKRVSTLTAERNAAEKVINRYYNNGASRDEFDAAERRVSEIGAEIRALEAARQVYDPKVLAKAIAFVWIDTNGTLGVWRGMVKGKVRQQKDAKKKSNAEGKKEAQKPGHPESLMRELTANVSFAIAAELIAHPGAALIAITHRLLLSQFYGGAAESMLRYAHGHGDDPIRIKADMEYSTDSGGRGAANQAERAKKFGLETKGNPDLTKIAAERAEIKAMLPKKDAELLDWLRDKEKSDGKLILRLLAYCVAESVDAVAGDEKTTRARAHALAQAVALDMRPRWTATPEAYLTRVNGATIRAALAEAGESKTAIAATEGMKKGELVAHAAPILASKRWVPKAMRFGSAK